MKQIKPITFDYLIVIEGTDGSGKKTHSTDLRNWMMKNNQANAEAQNPGTTVSEHDVLLLDFPDYGSPTGDLVKTMLSGTYGDDSSKLNSYFTSPMYAIDRYAYMTKMAREHGSHLPIGICNRYSISNLMHQGARLSPEELIQYWSWSEDYEYNRLGLQKPDLILYLDMPVAISHDMVVKRAQKQGIPLDINEKYEYMKLVDDNIRRISSLIGWKTINCYDAQGGYVRSIHDIQEMVRSEVTIDIMTKMNTGRLGGFNVQSGYVSHNLRDFVTKP